MPFTGAALDERLAVVLGVEAVAVTGIVSVILPGIEAATVSVICMGSAV